MFVDAIMVLPQAGTDDGVRRSTELLFGAAAKLAGKAKLDGTEMATLPGLLDQLATSYANTAVFDTNLAAQAEALFNSANTLCGWGLPGFDTANPGIPPRSGGAGMEI